MRQFIDIIENAHWGNNVASQTLSDYMTWENSLPQETRDLFNLELEKHSDDTVYIDNLVVWPEARGTGLANIVMNTIVQAARDNNARLTLVPVWQDDEEDPSRGRLSDWYRRQFGFVPVNGTLELDFRK